MVSMQTRTDYSHHGQSRWFIPGHPIAPDQHGRFLGFMLIEAASFLIAALAHHGVLVPGHEHALARAAELLIGSVLALAALASWLLPDHARRIGFIAQAFAFFATVLGLLMIAIGIGPRSIPDLIFNAGALLLLSLGLYVIARGSRM